MTPTLERAAHWLAEISAALATTATHVTDEPGTAPGALADGKPVAILQPPALEFPTWNNTTAEWELYVVAGPFQDHRAAWRTLDDLIYKLAEPLALDTAKPAVFSIPSGTDYPAYVLTFTDAF